MSGKKENHREALKNSRLIIFHLSNLIYLICHIFCRIVDIDKERGYAMKRVGS
jgi:hypothetical protein